MNQVGAHAFMWVSGWSEQECRKAIENAKVTGYDIIEIPVLDPSSIDVTMTRKVLDEVGLSATCSLGLSFETDISSTLAIWRNTWTDSLDLARHAREFIDAGLRGAQVAPTGA